MIKNKVGFTGLVIVIILVSLLLPVYANENNQYITLLEQQFFSSSYSSESPSDRISRLEETIFGQVFASDQEYVRIERLKAVLNINSNHFDEEVVHSSSSSNSITNDESISSNNLNGKNNSSSTYDDLYYDDVEVEDYPAVSLLEKQVFNKDYKGDDISKRLSRLEEEVFNEPRESNSLSQRMDDLKVAIVGSANMPVVSNRINNDSPVVAEYHSGMPQGNTYLQDPDLSSRPYFQSPEMNTFQQDPSMSVNQVNSMPSNQGYYGGQLSQESLAQVASKLEFQILGQEFPGQALNQRLDRLEMKVFNRTEVTSAPEARLERLVAVVAAENTSDPTDMKKVQRMRKVQTGLSIGGLLFTVLQGLLF